jgi:hypothetical protein
MQNIEGVHFDRRVLCYSFEGRPCEIITLTSLDGTEDDKEEIPFDSNEFVYPIEKVPSKSIGKPTVFITSRVHCGETVASFFLKGMFDLLASDSE